MVEKDYYKDILTDYSFLYKTMVREGILSLEDHVNRAESICCFKYPFFAFVDAHSGETCLKMYEAMEKEIRELDYDYDWLRKLAEEFFVNSEKQFDYIDYNKTGWEARIADVDKHIDEFVNDMISYYV